MRKEPSVGQFITNAARFAIGQSKTSHEDLVTDALDAFTKAELKMETAIRTISDQITAEEIAIQEARERQQAATSSKDKLSRVLDRVRALTA